MSNNVHDIVLKFGWRIFIEQYSLNNTQLSVASIVAGFNSIRMVLTKWRIFVLLHTRNASRERRQPTFGGMLLAVHGIGTVY